MAVTSVAADDLRNSYIPCIGGRPLSGFTKPLARLIDQFERLPGIGPRTAQRLALHLLNPVSYTHLTLPTILRV